MAPDDWILETESTGYVVAASVGAATLFNLTPRGLRGRDVLLFFSARIALARHVHVAAACHESVTVTVALRPIEQRPRLVNVTLTSAGDGRVRWQIADA